MTKTINYKGEELEVYYSTDDMITENGNTEIIVEKDNGEILTIHSLYTHEELPKKEVYVRDRADKDSITKELVNVGILEEKLTSFEDTHSTVDRWKVDLSGVEYKKYY